MEPSRLRTSDSDAPAQIRAQAFEIIRAKSFFRRRITLASGRESDFYFNMKPTMFDPQGAMLLARMLLARVAELKSEYVGGLAVGAIPLIATVCALSSEAGRPLSGFFVRKEVKDHGTRQRIDGLEEGATLAGKPITILEDVTTTGGSAMLAVQAAREAGAQIETVLSVVDRGEGAAETYRAAGVPFTSLFRAQEFLASS